MPRNKNSKHAKKYLPPSYLIKLNNKYLLTLIPQVFFNTIYGVFNIKNNNIKGSTTSNPIITNIVNINLGTIIIIRSNNGCLNGSILIPYPPGTINNIYIYNYKHNQIY